MVGPFAAVPGCPGRRNSARVVSSGAHGKPERVEWLISKATREGKRTLLGETSGVRARKRLPAGYRALRLTVVFFPGSSATILSLTNDLAVAL